MATPASLQALHLPPGTPRTPSPWPGRALPALILHFSVSSRKKGQRLTTQARARGFSQLAAAEKKKRSRKEDDDGGPGKLGKDGGGGGNDGEDDAIPELVFDRMVRRVVASVATPMAGGVGLLYVMSSLKESGAWDVPAWLPFVTTLVCFGSSALGIAYGTLSTSWDPEREGSALGWGEVRRNWPELWKDDDGEPRR